ncbi:hypothetical protein ACFL7M_12360 [Thermodesulfobacteriota bacterium]
MAKKMEGKELTHISEIMEGVIREVAKNSTVRHGLPPVPLMHGGKRPGLTVGLFRLGLRLVGRFKKVGGRMTIRPPIRPPLKVAP